ncbi:hypothetical protein ACDF64_05730 [Agromyces sp. MMS24-JH15]|uniref:hypothetical protein n=1 Tax=Agromyces sp. MMS24-JH15 TaxID=3243765 RepID=UPI003747E6DB
MIGAASASLDPGGTSSELQPDSALTIETIDARSLGRITCRWSGVDGAGSVIVTLIPIPADLRDLIVGEGCSEPVVDASAPLTRLFEAPGSEACAWWVPSGTSSAFANLFPGASWAVDEAAELPGAERVDVSGAVSAVRHGDAANGVWYATDGANLAYVLITDGEAFDVDALLSAMLAAPE